MKRLVLFLLIAAGVVLGLNYTHGRTVDGARNFVLLLTPEQERATLAMRYWRYPIDERLTDQQLLEGYGVSELARRIGEGRYQISLPYSYNERGLFFPRRIDTAPLPKMLFLQVQDSAGGARIERLRLLDQDGKWLTQLRLSEQ